MPLKNFSRSHNDKKAKKSTYISRFTLGRMTRNKLSPSPHNDNPTLLSQPSSRSSHNPSHSLQHNRLSSRQSNSNLDFQSPRNLHSSSSYASSSPSPIPSKGSTCQTIISSSLPSPVNEYVKTHLKFKVSREFDIFYLSQTLVNSSKQLSNSQNLATNYLSQICKNDHPTWSMQFSLDGKFLAAAGHDNIIRLWSLVCVPQASSSLHPESTSSTPPPASYSTPTCEKSTTSSSPSNPPISPSISSSPIDPQTSSDPKSPSNHSVFHTSPFHTYHHQSTILDISWSKNNFLLSSSLDKSINLWHVSRCKSLHCFRPSHAITCLEFHPLDDRFFLSGSLDGQLQLWSIPDKRVTFSIKLPHVVTSLAFTPDGSKCVAGTLNGLLQAFHTRCLKLISHFSIPSSFLKKGQSSKITGIQIKNFPGSFNPNDTESRVLVSTNDSKIRMFRLDDWSIIAKFKGHVNENTPIRATFSDDGRYVISASEDSRTFIWSLDSQSTSPPSPSPPSLSTSSSPSPIPSPSLSKHKISNYSADISSSIIPLLSRAKSGLTMTASSFTSLNRSQSISGNVKADHPLEIIDAYSSKPTCCIFAPQKTHNLLVMSNLSINSSRETSVVPENLPSASLNTNSIQANHMRDSSNTSSYDNQSCHNSNHLSSLHSTSKSSLRNTHPNYGMIIISAYQSGTIRVYRQDVNALPRRANLESRRTMLANDLVGLSLQKSSKIATGISTVFAPKRSCSALASCSKNSDPGHAHSQSFTASTQTYRYHKSSESNPSIFPPCLKSQLPPPSTHDTGKFPLPLRGKLAHTTTFQQTGSPISAKNIIKTVKSTSDINAILKACISSSNPSLVDR